MATDYITGTTVSAPNAIPVQMDGTNQVVAVAAPGGGGAVALALDATIAAQSATIGTTADASWSGSGSSTVTAALKAIWTRLRGGQATMANSLPVVIASDQSALATMMGLIPAPAILSSSATGGTGTAYVYYVVPTYGGQDSSPSVVINLSGGATLGGAVHNDFAWGPVLGVDGYKIVRNVAGAGLKLIAVLQAGVTSFSDTGAGNIAAYTLPTTAATSGITFGALAPVARWHRNANYGLAGASLTGLKKADATYPSSLTDPLVSDANNPHSLNSVSDIGGVGNGAFQPTATQTAVDFDCVYLLASGTGTATLQPMFYNGSGALQFQNGTNTDGVSWTEAGDPINLIISSSTTYNGHTYYVAKKTVTIETHRRPIYMAITSVGGTPTLAWEGVYVDITPLTL